MADLNKEFMDLFLRRPSAIKDALDRVVADSAKREGAPALFIPNIEPAMWAAFPSELKDSVLAHDMASVNLMALAFVEMALLIKDYLTWVREFLEQGDVSAASSHIIRSKILPQLRLMVIDLQRCGPLMAGFEKMAVKGEAYTLTKDETIDSVLDQVTELEVSLWTL